MPTIPQYFSKVDLQTPPTTPTMETGVAMAGATAIAKAGAQIFETASRNSFHYADVMDRLNREEANTEGHRRAADTDIAVSKWYADNFSSTEDPVLFHNRFIEAKKDIEGTQREQIKDNRYVKDAFEKHYIPYDLRWSEKSANQLILGKERKIQGEFNGTNILHIERLSLALADPDIATADQVMQQYRDFLESNRNVIDPSKGVEGMYREGVSSAVSAYKKRLMRPGMEEQFMAEAMPGGRLSMLSAAGVPGVEGPELEQYRQHILSVDRQNKNQQYIDTERARKEVTDMTLVEYVLSEEVYDENDIREIWDGAPELAEALGPEGQKTVLSAARARVEHEENKAQQIQHAAYFNLADEYMKSRGEYKDWIKTIGYYYEQGSINAREHHELLSMHLQYHDFARSPEWEMAKNGLMRQLDPNYNNPFAAILRSSEDQTVMTNALFELYEVWKKDPTADSKAVMDKLVGKYRVQMSGSKPTPPPASLTDEATGRVYDLQNPKDVTDAYANKNIQSRLSPDQWKVVWAYRAALDNANKPAGGEKK